MLIGYARVSTTDQTLDLQKDALEKGGCSRIFTDTASGAREGAEFIAAHIIRVPETSFEDFIGQGADQAANRRMLGIG